ncbi:MAG: hypothetical protein SynsKO_20660 [Synoicihabitans sp.]
MNLREGRELAKLPADVEWTGSIRSAPATPGSNALLFYPVDAFLVGWVFTPDGSFCEFLRFWRQITPEPD